IDLRARDRRRVGHHLRHEFEKIEPEARGVTNAKLDRVGLTRHETLHQCLALRRDFLQLRRKDERVPSGLNQFVGHIFPLVVVRPVPGALASSERLPPATRRNQKMIKPQSAVRSTFCGAAKIVRCEMSSASSSQLRLYANRSEWNICLRNAQRRGTARIRRTGLVRE